MHDVLRQRLLRKIESLPDEQAYQVLDFIEFLESKYARATAAEVSGLQKFAENLEDKLRRKAVNPTTIREAFQLIATADKVLSGVSSAGKQILSELGDALEGPTEPQGKAPAPPAGPRGPANRGRSEGPSGPPPKGGEGDPAGR